MKIILNKTKNSSERYILCKGSMGNSGELPNHVNHHYEICNGVDRGNGYQGYIAVSYFLTLPYVPLEAKRKVIAICKKENLIYSHK